jgi:hypothetical protein
MFAMTEQEKNYLLIEVTAWASLTIFYFFLIMPDTTPNYDKVGD